jgi:hypothetical protein
MVLLHLRSIVFYFSNNLEPDPITYLLAEKFLPPMSAERAQASGPRQAVRGKGDLPFLSHHRDEHAPFRPGRHLFAGRAVFTWDLPLRERD